MIELGPEAIEGRISQVKEALESAESLTLVPAEALGEIKEEVKKLFEDLDTAYLDTVLAAKGDTRILLSDDLPFRVLAAEAASILAVWSQASVSYAGSIRKVPADDYFHLGNTLAEAKYFFTVLNVGNFFHELKKSNWVVTPTLKAMIDLLARSANEPQGVLNVMSDLAKLGWPLKPNDEAYEALFTKIFAAFKKAQPDRDLEMTTNIVFGRIQEFLRSRFLPRISRPAAPKHINEISRSYRR
jgi:hypothetical protein